MIRVPPPPDELFIMTKNYGYKQVIGSLISSGKPINEEASDYVENLVHTMMSEHQTWNELKT